MRGVPRLPPPHCQETRQSSTKDWASKEASPPGPIGGQRLPTHCAVAQKNGLDNTGDSVLRGQRRC
eukprot:4429347-Prorocentrum_lima.AAC.1